MPQQFWGLTFKEFEELYEGYKWRNKREWEQNAQLAAWIISPHTKKPVTAKKLLGSGFYQDEAPQQKSGSIEDRNETLGSLLADMGQINT